MRFAAPILLAPILMLLSGGSLLAQANKSAAAEQLSWKAGLATAVITPKENMWMAVICLAIEATSYSEM